MNKKYVKKSIRNIIDCDFKTNLQISVIFGANIFDKIGHQTTVLVPTLPNVHFCTTCEKQNKL